VALLCLCLGAVHASVSWPTSEERRCCAAAEAGHVMYESAVCQGGLLLFFQPRVGMAVTGTADG
jgi:hypothetical protein